MKATNMTAKFIFVSIVILLNFSITTHWSVAQTSVKSNNTGKAGKNKNAQQFVSIDFNNVDINVLIKFMSELTDTNFVVDQRVKGEKSLKELAAQYQLHPNQIKNWRSILRRRASNLMEDKRHKKKHGPDRGH